jgi:hypothetical protein
MKKDNKNTELDNADKKLHISDVMRLLCNETANIWNIEINVLYLLL